MQLCKFNQISFDNWLERVNVGDLIFGVALNVNNIPLIDRVIRFSSILQAR